jgi:cysteinyl-tRNA synthetase
VLPRGRPGRRWALLVLLAVQLTACTAGPGAATVPGPDAGDPSPGEPPRSWRSFVYQLQGYRDGGLDEIAGSGADLAVIDPAGDGTAPFTRAQIAALRAAGTDVLAYFEVGSLEEFRPDYAALRRECPDLFLNEWPSWPGEHFVRYWDPRWWERAIRPRVDQALTAGYDGVYLDTPLAYEEIDLALVPGETRGTLATAMVALIGRLSAYAKAIAPGFLVFPQNSPELRRVPGYLEAVDGIGVESLFFRPSDQPCDLAFCAEDLDEARAIRRAGRTVLAIDYAVVPENVARACRHHREEGFLGYVTTPALDSIRPPCR